MYKCFWSVRTDLFRRELRRFVWSSKEKCPLPWGYHTASIHIDDAECPSIEHDLEGSALDQFLPKDDPRWPKACGCGYQFKEEDEWQWNRHRLYRHPDTGVLFEIRDAPVGAMWDAHWMGNFWKGSDGRALTVQTPGGSWSIDSEASNCTRKGDSSHKCWIRHGEPPNITVDKNGNTCAAGSGSIICGSYHGFLQNGYLTAGM